jgi:predicted ATPase/DNA-binding SARP family transcriptional activator
MVAVLKVGLCGGVALEVDGRRIPDSSFAGRQGRLVWAYLVLERHRSVHREELAELLWPDRLPSSWTSSLSVVVSKLRRLLGDMGLDPTEALAGSFGSYRLLLTDEVWIDWEVAAERVEHAEAAVRSARFAAAVAAAEEATEIARRGFLSDDCVWVDTQRDRLRDLHVRALVAQAQAHLEAGERGRAVIVAREALAVDELREASYRLLMQALAASGERGEALRVWERCRLMLADELGVDPAPETEAVYLSILGNEPVSSRPPQKLELPSGVVTFLLTDIEGSTGLWESQPEAMTEALARHDELAAGVVATQRGVLVKTRGEGDSTFSVFASVSQAVAAAINLQAALLAEPFPGGIALRVRSAIHTGEAELRDGDYFGSTVNRAARLRGIGHGGQVLCSQSSAQLLEERLPEGAVLRSLGQHRLQDLARPEAVFQLEHPAFAAKFPPLRSLEALPNNLPGQLTSFVGRQQEMADLTGLLAEHRLVTLTGAAGCGKTRLAVQLGAERLRDYADGVWLVDLAPLGDPDLLVQAVATTLAVRDTPATVVSAAAGMPAGRSLIDLVVDHLRTRSILVVLDNCEHLLEPVAVLAETLLRACPQLRILATSREALGVSGEVTWRLRSLSVPAAQAGGAPRELLQYEAVYLFVDRAKACVPSFELTDRDGPAVAQICRRLDGIPLALELAASRIEVLEPKELAARLDDRFRVLTGGSRTGQERHQTLRAAIDWSFDALPPAEQAAFSRLSVFAGGCTLSAAEAVCRGDGVEPGEVLDLLSRLVAKSLVLMDRDASPARYRMLETIRQYAREKLGTDAATELRKRHLDWCLEFTRQAERGVWGAEQMEWFDRLEDEEDNLRTALEWTIGGGDAEHALGLVAAMGRFWMVRRRVDEGLRWTLDALALDGSEFPYMRAKALVSAALSLCGYFGAYEEARRLSLQSLDLFRELGIRRGTFWALHTVSISALFQGDVETAVTYGEEALTVVRETGHPGTLVYGLLNRADVAIAEAEFDLVDSLLAEALPILRSIDDKIGLVRLLGIQGYVAIRAGRYTEAVPYLEETVVQSREIGDESAVVWALANLGCVALVTGDLPAAGRWFDAAQSAGVEAEELGGIWALERPFPHDAGAVDDETSAKPPSRTDAGVLEGLGLELRRRRRADPVVGAGSDQFYEPAISATSSGTIGAHDVGPAVGESRYLDVFLLNGLAELALAEGDTYRAAATFAEALRRLQPGDDGEPTATSPIALFGMPAAFGATFGMPAAGVNLLVGELQSGSAGAGVAAGRDLRRRRWAGPRGLPVAGLGVPVSAPRSGVLPGSAFTDIHRVRLANRESRPNDNTLARVTASPPDDRASSDPTDRTQGGATRALFQPTSAGVGDHVLVPSVVAGIAKVAVCLGTHERAARLFGAAENLRGFTTILHRQGRWILFEHLYDEMVTNARDALGGDAFDTAFCQGQALEGDAAIAHAIDTLVSVHE